MRVSDYFRHDTLIKQLKNLSVRLRLILMHQMSCHPVLLFIPETDRQNSVHQISFVVFPVSSQHKCCGDVRYFSWNITSWRQLPENTNLSVPDSCCKTMTPSCGRRDHPSNIYHKVSASLPITRPKLFTSSSVLHR